MKVGAETDIASVAAAIGDRSRTKVLLALADGRALPASTLAAEAGVTHSTVSEHLGRLLEAKLLTVQRDGRHRYYRLATPDVARALEELARIARPLPVQSLRQQHRTQALLRARLCYDHLAGQLGVALMDALLQRSLITSKQPPTSQTSCGGDRDVAYRLTEAGHQALTGFGVREEALPRADRDLRYCLDWSEQRPHLAGALGVALTEHLFDLGWIRRGKARRVIRLTDSGRDGLHTSLGLDIEWDVSAH